MIYKRNIPYKSWFKKKTAPGTVWEKIVRTGPVERLVPSLGREPSGIPADFHVSLTDRKQEAVDLSYFMISYFQVYL